jgi:WD40 repeat protein
VASLASAKGVRLVHVPKTAAIRAVAQSPDGQRTATAVVTSAAVEERQLHVYDRVAGRLSSYPLPGARPDSPDSGGVYALRFLGGALLSVGDGGLRRWDLATGRAETLLSLGCGTVGASADARRVVVGCLSGEDESQPGGPSSRVFVLDEGGGRPRVVENHGHTVQAVAIDALGRVLATGDNTGLVRVSGFDGGEPHLLYGASGVVASVDFSPDGRWIAAAVGNDVWLWPAPDVSRVPLQALPRAELVARLDAFTNQRVVEDPTAASGFRMSLEPFAGWRAVPRW